MNDEIDTQPRRSWISKDPNGKIQCYLNMKGRITLGDLYSHFTQLFPEVDFWNVALNFATATWEDDPTEAEIKQREAGVIRQRERTEEWERKTLARLKAKYEPEVAEPAQEGTT